MIEDGTEIKKLIQIENETETKIKLITKIQDLRKMNGTEDIEPELKI